MITRKQARNAKTQYPDAVVLARIGDFFEAFGEDARTLADVCDLILCHMPIDGGSKKVPLAGFPYWRKEECIEQLLQADHRVVVLEQIESRENHGQNQVPV